MSTYWGYVCVSHEPNLGSEQWFNWGQDTLRDAYVKERAGEWPDDAAELARYPALGPVPLPVNHRGHETASPIYWLRAHPNCEVVLENEYGDRESLGDIVGGSLVLHLPPAPPT